MVGVDKLLNTKVSRVGYSVIGAGKVYHGGLGMPEIWDETFTKGNGGKMVRHQTAKDDGVGGISDSISLRFSKIQTSHGASPL